MSTREQIDAVLSCADALQEIIEDAPEELRDGIRFSVAVLRATAEDFLERI